MNDDSDSRMPVNEPRALIIEEEEAPEPFELASFDPDEFEWRPVPRRPRADGWTPDVQQRFIEYLADTGVVSAACEAVDMSVRSAYRLRNARGAESFRRAWDMALAAAADRLADLAFSRAIEGVEEPVFDRDGCRIGSRIRYNDRLMMFLLRAYRPDRFRHAHQDVLLPGEPSPPLTVPVDQAVAALTPPAPRDPHLLMPPDRLECLVDGARGIAAVHDLYPPDDRERYVRPRREADHPAASARRQARNARDRDGKGRRDAGGN